MTSISIDFGYQSILIGELNRWIRLISDIDFYRLTTSAILIFRLSDSRSAGEKFTKKKQHFPRVRSPLTPLTAALFHLNASLSSAEASLYCGEAFVLWGGWGERKRERAGPPARFLFLSIIDILMGIPSGSLCGGESKRLERANFLEAFPSLSYETPPWGGGLLCAFVTDEQGEFLIFWFKSGSSWIAKTIVLNIIPYSVETIRLNHRWRY